MLPPLRLEYLYQKWADMFFKATDVGAVATQMVTALQNLPSVKS